MGAADPARSVHHGKSHPLVVSENQRPHIQHHVEREREGEISKIMSSSASQTGDGCYTCAKKFGKIKGEQKRVVRDEGGQIYRRD